MSNLFHVPLYLKATSADELVKAMIKTNIKSSMINKYFDIQYSKGYWYAWYISNASDLVKKVIKDGIEKNS